MSIDHPREGEDVDVPCRFCEREARPGEKFGTGPKDWDYTGICPECWDERIGDSEEDDEEDPLAGDALELDADDPEAEALERDAVLETFGEEGLAYEEMTGKTLGDK